MSTTYEFELELDPVPSPYDGHKLIYDLKESCGLKLVRVKAGVFQGFEELDGEFVGPEEFHRRIQKEIPQYKLTSRWLNRSKIPWTHVFGPEEPTRVRKVSTEEYEKIYTERYEALDALPGGAQGAHPDMSDLEVELEDDE
jgi:hypothetical protein